MADDPGAPCLIAGHGRVYHVDPDPFFERESSASPSFHLCAETLALHKTLYAKIYPAEAAEAGEREAAAEKRLSVDAAPGTIIRFTEVVRADDGKVIIIMPFHLQAVANIVGQFLEPAKLAGDDLKPPVHFLAMTALGVASALAHIHGLGLAHCDVKPANIMVRPEDGVPVLVGFAGVTEMGLVPHQTSPQWIPYTDSEGPATHERLLAQASAELDLRCLASTVVSISQAISEGESASHATSHEAWSLVAGEPEAQLERLCWDMARAKSPSAAQLRDSLAAHIRAHAMLTDAEIEACLR